MSSEVSYNKKENSNTDPCPDTIHPKPHSRYLSRSLSMLNPPDTRSCVIAFGKRDDGTNGSLLIRWNNIDQPDTILQTNPYQ